MHFIGIDVSKHKLDCLLIRISCLDKPRHKVVSNTPEGIKMMLEWACKQADCDVAECPQLWKQRDLIMKWPLKHSIVQAVK